MELLTHYWKKMRMRCFVSLTSNFSDAKNKIWGKNTDWITGVF